MVKKKSFNFLILEVLISFLLLSLSVLPFSSYPYRAFKKEIGYLEQLEMEPYFSKSFFAAYEQMDKKNLESESFELDELSIPFGKNEKLGIKRFVTVKKESALNKKGKLITIILTLKAPHKEITLEKCFYLKENKETN